MNLKETRPGVGREKFIGRRDEVDGFNNWLGQLQRTGLSRTIIHLSGPKGVGKTALLGEFGKQAKAKGIPAVGIEFDEPARGDVTVVLERLLDGLAGTGDKERKTKITGLITNYRTARDEAEAGLRQKSEMFREFDKFLGQKAEQSPVVLMFDDSDNKGLPEIYPELEKWGINPWCQDGKIMTVWANQGQKVVKRFEVSRRMSKWELAGFDRKEAQEQGRQAGLNDDKLNQFLGWQEITQGHPMANQVMIEGIEQELSREELVKKLKTEFVDGFLLDGVEDNQVIRAIELLSAVRAGWQGYLKEVLGEFEEFEDIRRDKWLYNGGLTERIVKTYLTVDRGIDPVFRPMIREWLRQEDPQAFEKINRAVINEYDRVIDKYGAGDVLLKKWLQLAEWKGEEVGNWRELVEADIKKACQWKRGDELSSALGEIFRSFKDNEELREAVGQEQAGEIFKIWLNMFRNKNGDEWIGTE